VPALVIEHYKERDNSFTGEIHSVTIELKETNTAACSGVIEQAMHGAIKRNILPGGNGTGNTSHSGGRYGGAPPAIRRIIARREDSDIKLMNIPRRMTCNFASH
jgi:hypothetical protein